MDRVSNGSSMRYGLGLWDLWGGSVGLVMEPESSVVGSFRLSEVIGVSDWAPAFPPVE